MNQSNHAVIHRVVLMHFASNEMKSALVDVFLNIMEIHTLNVVLNVFLIPNAHRIVPV